MAERPTGVNVPVVFTDDEEPTDEKPTKTPWGWEDSGKYNDALKKLGGQPHRATLEPIQGVVPTQVEAEALAQKLGGKVIRAESGHPAEGVSTHTFDHILIELPNGNRVTVRVTEVVNPYGTKSGQ